jgi:hypothetical protein
MRVVSLTDALVLHLDLQSNLSRTARPHVYQTYRFSIRGFLQEQFCIQIVSQQLSFLLIVAHLVPGAFCRFLPRVQGALLWPGAAASIGRSSVLSIR